jgi:hypothetical protein
MMRRNITLRYVKQCLSTVDDQVPHCCRYRNVQFQNITKLTDFVPNYIVKLMSRLRFQFIFIQYLVNILTVSVTGKLGLCCASNF